MKKDYYKILGVSSSSSPDEIKKAYRKIAIKYHPDKNNGDKISEEKFKEAAEAYNVLGDKKKRERYDLENTVGFRGFSNGGFGYNGGFNVDDIFSNLFGGYSRRKQQQNTVIKGKNIRITMELTLEELFKGVSKTISFKAEEKCENCGGSGAKDKHNIKTCSSCKGSGKISRIVHTIIGDQMVISHCNACNGKGTVIEEKCKTCNGLGLNEQNKTVTVEIPRGVKHNDVLRINSEGSDSNDKNGARGDLLVSIREIPHNLFKREGANLIHEHYISMLQSIVGGELEIPSIDGKIKITIPHGTEYGSIMRLQGKGMYKTGTNYRGDYYLKIKIWIPKTINEEERKLLNKLEKMQDFKIKE